MAIHLLTGKWRPGLGPQCCWFLVGVGTAVSLSPGFLVYKNGAHWSWQSLLGRGAEMRSVLSCYEYYFVLG